MLASELVPCFVINRIVWLTIFIINSRLAQRLNFMKNLKVQKWAPVGVGLCSIPVIIHPIDNSVDYFMDNTFRPFMESRRSKVELPIIPSPTITNSDILSELPSESKKAYEK